jgi:microcystin-dependent protein
LSVDSALFPHLGDAITALTNDDEWTEVNDSVADVVAACKDAVEIWYSDMLIGALQTFLIIPPPGWLVCDGATYDKIDYPELWAVLPSQLTTENDFTLPDFTAAFLAGTDTESEIGDTAGQNSFALSEAELPAHSHLYTPPTLTVETGGAGPPIPAADLGTPTQTGDTGSGDDIDNRPAHVLVMIAIFTGRV